MYYQDEPGIYVYFLKDVYYGDYRTTKIAYGHYETLEDFFWCHNERNIKENIGYSVYDKICHGVVHATYRRGYRGRYIRNKVLCGKVNCTEHHEGYTQAYAVYDQDGNLYTPDRLIGLRRDWVLTKPKNKYRYRWYRQNGHKKQAWGGWRSIKTFQERKWAHAWDDEEFAPKPRPARQGKNLPDSWDDYRQHCDKSWKTQSKRKRQWKEK